MDYPTAQVERFRVLNALGANDQILPGQKVKLVVRGR
jgi:predicted Zn-dependent protease